MKWFKILWFIVLISLTKAKKGFGPGEQDYGYVNVRNGAHMFWWLFHTTANVSDSSVRPLVMWLQGGPGGSSCGYGNFAMLGPLNINLEPRNTTWVNDFNVLFVDNPVGTGYSYVEDTSLLAKDNQQIARDLVTLMKSFYEQLPKFKTTPFYVYGQSYGGKMGVDFVRLLHEEVEKGNIISNVSGVAMGNSWISPIDSTLSWGPFLYKMSLVDEEGMEAINQQAQITKAIYSDKKYANAFDEWRKTQHVVNLKTDGVDYYNVLTKIKRSENSKKINESNSNSKPDNERHHSLTTLMNGPVKEALNIPNEVEWKIKSNDAFDSLKQDFMKPVTHVVESLLNDTNIKVQVYNGNIDLICNTPGQMEWINKLRWPDKSQYQNATRNTIRINDIMEGYEKNGGKFTMFWVNVAGHSVPVDNPAAMRHILEAMTGV